MKYNRKESFRYTFQRPLLAQFQILVADGETGETRTSKKGDCQILDISRQGLRIYSLLNLPYQAWNPVTLSIDFVLVDQPLRVIGTILWKKARSNGHEYGLKLDVDEVTESLIVEELKKRRQLDVQLQRSERGE